MFVEPDSQNLNDSLEESFDLSIEIKGAYELNKEAKDALENSDIQDDSDKNNVEGFRNRVSTKIDELKTKRDQLRSDKQSASFISLNQPIDALEVSLSQLNDALDSYEIKKEKQQQANKEKNDQKIVDKALGPNLELTPDKYQQALSILFRRRVALRSDPEADLNELEQIRSDIELINQKIVTQINLHNLGNLQSASTTPPSQEIAPKPNVPPTIAPVENNQPQQPQPTTGAQIIMSTTASTSSAKDTVTSAATSAPPAPQTPPNTETGGPKEPEENQGGGFVSRFRQVLAEIMRRKTPEQKQKIETQEKLYSALSLKVFGNSRKSLGGQLNKIGRWLNNGLSSEVVFGTKLSGDIELRADLVKIAFFVVRVRSGLNILDGGVSAAQVQTDLSTFGQGMSQELKQIESFVEDVFSYRDNIISTPYDFSPDEIQYLLDEFVRDTRLDVLLQIGSPIKNQTKQRKTQSSPAISAPPQPTAPEIPISASPAATETKTVNSTNAKGLTNLIEQQKLTEDEISSMVTGFSRKDKLFLVGAISYISDVLYAKYETDFNLIAPHESQLKIFYAVANMPSEMINQYEQQLTPEQLNKYSQKQVRDLYDTIMSNANKS